MINQAIFNRLTIHDPDTIKAQRTPVFEAIAQMAQNGKNGPQRGRNGSGAQNDHDPLLGAGVRIKQTAGRTGQFSNHTALDRLLGELLEPVGREAQRRAADACGSLGDRRS